MRTLLGLCLIVGAAACSDPNNGYPGGIYGDGNVCHSDADCASNTVCSHVGACLDPAGLRTVHAMWTIGGQPASAVTCGTDPELTLLFTSESSNDIGFAPIACTQGSFTLDKLPRSYIFVEMQGTGPGDGHSFWFASASVDSSGNAMMDLQMR